MPEQLVKLLTRRTTAGPISMWGTLHLDIREEKLAGWLCNSWTEAGVSSSEVLLPRIHWLNKNDNRFYLAKLTIPTAGNASVMLGPVDENIEPRRESFMRETLAQWENEFFTEQGVQLLPKSN